MKKLNELIKCDYNIDILGIVSDTREISSGYLFVAIKGFNVDRFEFIEEAIKKGAAAIIADRKPDFDMSVPLILVDNVNKVYLDLLSEFYDHVNEKMSFIGITGTDGKTTTATILADLLNRFTPTAYTGTNGVKFNNETSKLNNTTPEPAILYSALKSLEDKGCKVVSMEVSSEALLHGRCDNIEMDYAILTNISGDHLNIHGTMENYINAKKKLFYLLKDTGKAIVNRDDEHYDFIVNGLKKDVYSYGVNPMSNFVIQNVNKKGKFTQFEIKYNDEIYLIESPYFGLYNVYNLTAAIAVLLLEKYDFNIIKELIKNLKPIPGRGEVLEFNQNYTVILDYAHTTNGIRSILEAVHNYNFNRIITVVGSAGGREREKRAHMGQIILNESDTVIFTMDDPRNEKVNDIIDDLVSDSNKDNYIRIIDRKEAIHHALSIAKKDDVVLILGKGRDTYMAVGSEKYDYCDYDVIVDYFK